MNMSDEVFRRLAMFADRGAPTTPAQTRRQATPPPIRLPSLLQDAALTRLADVPLDRALRRVLVEMHLQDAVSERVLLPPAQELERILVVRSAGAHVLDRLIEDVLRACPPAVAHVICHEKEIEPLGARWGSVVRPVSYPRFGPYETDVLRDLIDTEVPSAVSSAFFLDNNPNGMGAGLEHVEAALDVDRIANAWVFNAGGALYRVKTCGEGKRSASQLPSELLRWYARIEATLL